MLKNNPLIEEYSNIKLINKKKLTPFTEKTRNYNSRVFRCTKSNLIINEKCPKNFNDYYHKIYWSNQNNIAGTKFKSPPSINYENKYRMESFIKFIKNKKILDFGCGDLSFLMFCYKHTNKLYGCDLSRFKDIKQVKFFRNINEIHENFDSIFLFHTFHLLENPVFTLKYLFKLLNKNGKIIIEIPNADNLLMSIPEFRKFTFSIESLVIYNKRSIEKLMKILNFKYKVDYFQRYNLNNFMHWCNSKEPGGHNYNIYSKKSNRYFLDYFQNEYSDTLRIIIGK